MKLIKIKNGYVNADKLESFVVIEHEGYCSIVAYSPIYECYPLGRCAEVWDAYQRLNTLAERLVKHKYGIFDIMHLWESDDDES